jgi:hypothetical protein
MRLTPVLSTLLLLSAAVACDYAARRPPPRPTPPRPTIPAASDVASVRLKSIGSSLQHKHDVTLTKEPDIGAVVDWLKQIDWSPSKADDLSNVMLAEVGQLTVTMKDGATHSFGLSGGMIIVNRWEWPGRSQRGHSGLFCTSQRND